MQTLKEKVLREGYDLDNIEPFVNYSYYRGFICFKTDTNDFVEVKDPRYKFKDRKVLFCPSENNNKYQITFNLQDIYTVEITKKNPSCLDIWEELKNKYFS
jgi:hypothetical protein